MKEVHPANDVRHFAKMNLRWYLSVFLPYF